MSSLDFLHIRVKLPLRIQACWHILTHWGKVKLTCIISNDWFTNFLWTSDEFFINYSVSSENNERSTSLLYFVHTNLYHLRKMVKTCSLQVCVDICLLDLVEYIQVSTYIPPCYDENELFFALLPGLEQHPCCCTTSKSLWTQSFRFSANYLVSNCDAKNGGTVLIWSFFSACCSSSPLFLSFS